jgi:hypothetical protein
MDSKIIKMITIGNDMQGLKKQRVSRRPTKEEGRALRIDCTENRAKVHSFLCSLGYNSIIQG